MKTKIQSTAIGAIAIDKSKGAHFSESKKYRYKLWRIWDNTKPLVMFIGLNPSTADASDDDPTVESVTRIALHNGYGGFYMMNLFPLVSTDPKAVLEFEKEEFGHNAFDKENARHLNEVRHECEDVVFAWGNFKVVRTLGRDQKTMEYFKDAKAIGHNKNGSPKHALYQPGKSILIKFKYPPISK